MNGSRRAGGVSLVLAAVLLVPGVGLADEQTDIMQLSDTLSEQSRTLNQQQATIQQLMEKVSTLQARMLERGRSPAVNLQRVNLEDDEVGALPVTADPGVAVHDVLEISGYVDFGYVDAAGSGLTASSTSLTINSRGDRLSDVGLDGDSSFLINEVNLDLKAHVSKSLDAVVSFDLLPRSLSFTTSGGTAATDSLEVDLAHIVYAPFQEPNPLADTLFGDLQLSVGKFLPPLGREYLANESPDRVNITRSHQAIYSTGHPVGLKAKGNLLQEFLGEFRNSLLTYNVVLANADPFLARVGDGDRDKNSKRTIMGRLSYALDGVGGRGETGVSLLAGPRIGQGDNNAITESIGVDAQFERGPLTLRAEWLYADEDAPRTGGRAVVFSGAYFEGFYDLGRPEWLSASIPMISLTPYYRYDLRDFNLIPSNSPRSNSQTDVKRHTFALRYIPRFGTFLKGEVQINAEAEGADVKDDLFLMSLVQQF